MILKLLQSNWNKRNEKIHIFKEKSVWGCKMCWRTSKVMGWGGFCIAAIMLVIFGFYWDALPKAKLDSFFLNCGWRFKPFAFFFFEKRKQSVLVRDGRCSTCQRRVKFSVSGGCQILPFLTLIIFSDDESSSWGVVNMIQVAGRLCIGSWLKLSDKQFCSMKRYFAKTFLKVF